MSKREEKKLSVPEVAASLKMNKKYITAMENNNFALLPSQVYAKGFLNAYSELLGLDTNSLLNDLAEYYREAEELKKPKPASSTKPKRTYDINYMYLAYSFAIIFIVLLVVTGLHVASDKKAQPKHIASVITASNLGQQKEPETLKEAKNVELKIEATERTWVYVIIDSKETYSETLEPGDVLTFSGKVISVKVGNASAIKIFRDGKPYGAMGESKVVAEQTYRAIQ